MWRLHIVWYSSKMKSASRPSVQRSRHLCLCLFWKFQEPKIKIKQNWVHPKSKGRNPYFAKEKTYSVQTGLTKTKETKEIQRDEDEDSSSGSTNSGPLWPCYRKRQAGQQLWSVSTNHWRVGTLSSPMWKLLSKEMCHINIANICLLTSLSIVSRSAASSSSAIVLTSIWQPSR